MRKNSFLFLKKKDSPTDQSSSPINITSSFDSTHDDFAEITPSSSPSTPENEGPKKRLSLRRGFSPFSSIDASPPSQSSPLSSADVSSLTFNLISNQPVVAYENVLPDDESLPKHERMRNKVINEIINTERGYMEDLDTLVSVYLQPLRESGVLKEEQIHNIFSNVEMILQINKAILDLLVAQIQEHSANGIGLTFIKVADYLKVLL